LSHPLFAEIAHDFLMGRFVCFLHLLVRRTRAKTLRGRRNVRQNISMFDGNFVDFHRSSANRRFGSVVGVVKDPGERTIANAQSTLKNLDDHAQRNASG
jgi:hypothetical protein